MRSRGFRPGIPRRTCRARLRVVAVCILSLLVLLPLQPSRAALRNQLENHPSPYLAMHADDPVAWQQWSPAVLELARRENRLVLISSGYFACHWCHVMQRESFRDQQVAELLNRHFVAVKVDREVLPALDRQLVGFVKRTRGQAGWPLNVFVTPDGYPLLGATYLPRDNLVRLLENLVERWKRDTRHLEQLARSAQETRPAGREKPQRRLLEPAYFEDRLVESAMRFADETAGGFGQQSKFPMVPQLMALLEVAAARPQAAPGEFLALTLDNMAGAGLRDHIGGGFFRYTVDPAWQVPHFEKMLYDNAQLVRLYLRGARVLRDPAYAAVATETLDFMLREMWNGEGAFVASFSAVDEHDVEGGYYLWSPAEVRAHLTGEQWRAVESYWGLDRPPALDHGHLLRPVGGPAASAASLGMEVDEFEALVASARRALLVARAGRGRLPVDEKLIAGWNGLALSALVAASSRPGGRKYLPYARILRGTLVRRFWTGTGMVRALRGERVFGEAALEDYAYVLRALWEWRQAFGATRDDDRLLEEIAGQAWERFRGEAGWAPGGDTGLRVADTEISLDDGVLPSPAAVLLGTTLEMEREMKVIAPADRVRAALSDLVYLRPAGLLWSASYLDAVRLGERRDAPNRRQPPPARPSPPPGAREPALPAPR